MIYTRSPLLWLPNRDDGKSDWPTEQQMTSSRIAYIIGRSSFTLRMDEIPHHLRNPGMHDSPNANQNGFNHGFLGGANWISQPSTVVYIYIYIYTWSLKPPQIFGAKCKEWHSLSKHLFLNKTPFFGSVPSKALKVHQRICFPVLSR